MTIRNLKNENIESQNQIKSLKENIKNLESEKENILKENKELLTQQQKYKNQQDTKQELWEDKNIKSVDNERIKTLFYLTKVVGKRRIWLDELLETEKLTNNQIEIIKKEQEYLKEEWLRYKNSLDSLMEKIGEMNGNE